MYEGQTSFLPLKLNTSGVIPPIFASSLLLMPATMATFAAQGGPSGCSGQRLSRPRFAAVHVLYAALIIFFAFSTPPSSSTRRNRRDNLKKQGGFIPGIRPGEGRPAISTMC